MYILSYNALVLNWAKGILSLLHCCLWYASNPKAFHLKEKKKKKISVKLECFSSVCYTYGSQLTLCLRYVVYSSFHIHRVYFWILKSIYLLKSKSRQAVKNSCVWIGKNGCFHQEFLMLVWLEWCLCQLNNYKDNKNVDAMHFQNNSASVVIAEVFLMPL